MPEIRRIKKYPPQLETSAAVIKSLVLVKQKLNMTIQEEHTTKCGSCALDFSAVRLSTNSFPQPKSTFSNSHLATSPKNVGQRLSKEVVSIKRETGFTWNQGHMKDTHKD